MIRRQMVGSEDVVRRPYGDPLVRRMQVGADDLRCFPRIHNSITWHFDIPII